MRTRRAPTESVHIMCTKKEKLKEKGNNNNKNNNNNNNCSAGHLPFTQHTAFHR